jgi:HEAT repeat protein
MRSVRSILMTLLALLLLASSVSSQTKDKEKDTKKEPSKLPTEIGGKTMDTWMKELHHPSDPAVKQTAIQTIVHFGPPAKKAIPTLITLLSDYDATVRGDAATALGLLLAGLDPKDKAVGGDEETLRKGIAALSYHINDDQRYVRFRVINTVSGFGPLARTLVPNVMTNLLSSLRDSSSWEVRKASATALGRVAGGDPKEGPDSRAVKALTETLDKEGCAPVRLEAVNALLVLGLSTRTAEVDAEKKALMGRFNDSDKVVALSARTLLMLIDEKQLTPVNLDKLAKYLNEDTDLRVRCQAANALGMLGKKAKAKVPDVINAASDKENELSLAAVVALSRMEDPSAVPTLTRLMKSTTTHIAIRCQAARSIGSIGDDAKGAVPDLVELLPSKDPELVIAAVAGLVLIGEAALPALPDIKKLTSHTNEDVKATATEAVKILEKLAKKKKE